MSGRVRIPRLVLSPFGPVYLVKVNPWVPVWWSVAMPGFGHLRVGQNFTGLLLITWEILVNTQARINLAIFYSVLGQFDRARAILDYRWAVVYPLVYIFAMVDSYRIAIERNQLAEQERVQRRHRLDRVTVTFFGSSALTQRNPALAVFWSTLLTGFGQLYNYRLFKAVVLMGWSVTILMRANVGLAFYYTFLGQFAQAAGAVNYQWLLYWPSITVFGIADAYSDCVELNRLADMAFRDRMAPYLKNEAGSLR